MKKPTYDLSSSKAQFRAESPKSGNLSTIPKRSLNADVAQWVANGGVVTVGQVQDVRVKPDVPLNRQPRGEQMSI